MFFKFIKGLVYVNIYIRIRIRKVLLKGQMIIWHAES